MGRTNQNVRGTMAKKAPRKSIPINKKSSIDESTKKKSRRLAPGIKSLREIKYYQGTVDSLIPKKRMVLLIRELATEESLRHALLENGVRFSAAALEALRIASEAYLVDFLGDSYKNTIHRNCITLNVKDVRKTMGEGGWRNLHGENSNTKVISSAKIHGSLKFSSKKKVSDESDEKPKKTSGKRKASNEEKGEKKKSEKKSTKKGKVKNEKSEESGQHGKKTKGEETNQEEEREQQQVEENIETNVKSEHIENEKEEPKQIKSPAKKTMAKGKRKQAAPKKSQVEKEPDSPQHDFSVTKRDRSKSPISKKAFKTETNENQEESGSNAEEEEHEPAYKADESSEVTPYQEMDNDEFSAIYKKINKISKKTSATNP